MIFQYIHQLFIDNPEAFSCIGFLGGLLVGNWLSIGRDRRKEFNDIADPIRVALIGARSGPSAHFVLGEAEVDRIIYTLPVWKRRGFSLALSKYNKAKQGAERRSPDGGVFYELPSDFVKHIETLLSYVRRK